MIFDSFAADVAANVTDGDVMGAKTITLLIGDILVENVHAERDACVCSPA